MAVAVIRVVVTLEEEEAAAAAAVATAMELELVARQPVVQSVPVLVQLPHFLVSSRARCARHQPPTHRPHRQRATNRSRPGTSRLVRDATHQPRSAAPSERATLTSQP